MCPTATVMLIGARTAYDGLHGGELTQSFRLCRFILVGLLSGPAFTASSNAQVCLSHPFVPKQFRCRSSGDNAAKVKHVGSRGGREGLGGVLLH